MVDQIDAAIERRKRRLFLNRILYFLLIINFVFFSYNLYYFATRHYFIRKCLGEI